METVNCVLFLFGFLVAAGVIWLVVTHPRIIPAGMVIAGGILVNHFQPAWWWVIPAAVIFAVIYMVAPRPRRDYRAEALQRLEQALDRGDVRAAQVAWGEIRYERLPPDLDKKWDEATGYLSLEIL